MMLRIQGLNRRHVTLPYILAIAFGTDRLESLKGISMFFPLSIDIQKFILKDRDGRTYRSVFLHVGESRLPAAVVAAETVAGGLSGGHHGGGGWGLGLVMDFGWSFGFGGVPIGGFFVGGDL
jgi:hypothetical protein